MPRSKFRLLVLSVVFFSLVSIAFSASAAGLLRVHPTNPRYFTDDSGKAIYLAGHQIFSDIQDNSFGTPLIYNFQPRLDWNWYLQFMKDRNLNYIRNWNEFSTGSFGAVAGPMQFQRVSGYGNANDGGLKFDLTKFNQEFFDRMRSRIIEAGNNDIYFSIMLFDYYAFLDYSSYSPHGDPSDNQWSMNLFHSANNINGIHVDVNGDGHGEEFFTNPSPEVKIIQQNYVKKVLDTIADLDNVFIEISNEAPNLSWHYEMIDFIKDYQATKPKKHLILHGPPGSYVELANGPSDVFSVLGEWDWFDIGNPPIDNSGKPAIFDMDHVAPFESFNTNYLWKAFTRGYHFTLYDQPFENPENESNAWEIARRNIGAAGNYANVQFSDLSKMNPSTTHCSTTFCLANPGSEYLIYQPSSGSFSVNLVAGTYSYEWFNPATANVAGTGSFTASSGNRSFTPPFSGSAVLYLRSANIAAPPPSLTPPTSTLATSLVLSQTTFAPNSTISVSISNAPGYTTDWAAVFEAGATGVEYSADWKYLNGRQSAPSSAVQNSTFAFTAPSIPGSYEIRLYRNNSVAERDRMATVSFNVISIAAASTALH